MSEVYTLAFKCLHCNKGLQLQISVLVSWDWLRHHCGSYGSYGYKQFAQKAALNKILKLQSRSNAYFIVI